MSLLRRTPRLALTFIVAAATASAEPSEPFSSVVSLHPRASAESLGGELLFIPQGDEAGEVRRVKVTGANPVTVKLAEGGWRVCAEVSGWWGRCASIEAGRDEPLRIDLWPTSRLSGSLRLARGVEGTIPAVVTAEAQPTWPPRAGLDFPKSHFRCPVDDQRRWTCDVPAGLVDVALRIQGFIPHYTWGLEAPRGEEAALGELVLRRGSSLVGQVTVEEGELTEGARAAVTPAMFSGSGSPGETKQLAQVRLEAPVDPRGFFQIQGIPPGSYVVEATQPGFAPARAFPIEVWPDAETVLERPLLLRKPLDLEVTIDPPRDWLDRPWRLRIFRHSEFSAGLDSDEVFLGSAGMDGRVVVADQPPGEFVVSVEDVDGNRLYGDLGRTVRTPAEAHIAVELDTVFVEGELVLGDEPLPGTLWFGGRHGAERAEMAADLEGRFAGVLPRDGRWRVEVEADEREIRAHTRVEVSPGPSGTARVRVELPDTELYGRVVDARGAAVEGAEVGLGADGRSVRTGSDAEGKFVFRGFPPGPVSVSARAKRQGIEEISDGTGLTVSESVPLGPVEIRLRPVRRFMGSLVSSRGPVAGAIVDAMPLRPPTAVFHDADRTDLEGRFELSVHPAVEAMQVTLSPPGFALSTQEISAVGEPVLEVAEEGGTLTVAVQRRSEATDRHRLVVLRDGLHVPMNLLRQWAEGHGVRWSREAPVAIPELAPGAYRACMGSRDDFARGFAEHGHWIAGLRHCADGYLTASGDLRLEIDLDTADGSTAEEADGRGR